MKIHPPIFLIIALTALFSGCETPSAPPPFLQKRLAPEWIASAQRIVSGGRTVYYKGHARRASATGTAGWAGTVTGEVMVLDPGMVIVVPAGTVTLTSDGKMKIAGQQHVITSTAPPWKPLLAQ